MTEKNPLVTRHSATRHSVADHSIQAPPRDIFNGFARVGLSGFGGVLPWVRRTVVDEKKWLSPAEFSGMLGLCQIVPGPSILSLSVCVGYRLAGWRGSIAAFGGLVLGPLMVVLLIASLYAQAIHLPQVAGLMRGISAVGIGLLLATGIRMLREGVREPVILWIVLPLCVLLVALHWRLHEAIAVCLPLSALLAYWRVRQERLRSQSESSTVARPSDIPSPDPGLIDPRPADTQPSDAGAAKPSSPEVRP